MPFKEKLSLKFLMVIFKIFKLASFSSRLSPRGRIFKRISITATLVPIAHEVTILIFSFVKPYQVTQFNHWLLLLFKIDCQGRNDAQFESFELHFSADIKKSILERKISVCENWNDLIREPAWIHKHGFLRTFFLFWEFASVV